MAFPIDPFGNEFGRHGLRGIVLGTSRSARFWRLVFQQKRLSLTSAWRPLQFLGGRKMNQATERLQKPGTLVKQVATQLSFDDPFYFSRTFKRVFGLSPERFRRLR